MAVTETLEFYRRVEIHLNGGVHVRRASWFTDNTSHMNYVCRPLYDRFKFICISDVPLYVLESISITE